MTRTTKKEQADENARARAAAVLAAVYDLKPDDISERWDAREITLIADAVAQAVKERDHQVSMLEDMNKRQANIITRLDEEIARLKDENSRLKITMERCSMDLYRVACP